MAVFTSLIFGLCVGIALVVGLSWYQKKKSATRLERALAVAAMANLDFNGMKKLNANVVPSWVKFLEFDKVNWLNFEVKKLWPHITEATVQVIREQVEPILASYCPTGIRSMKFKKLKLGDNHPSIEGIKVSSPHKGEVSMEMLINWQGDSDIVLAVETMVGLSLEFGLKELIFNATVRIIFRFIEDMPCIGALAVSLREDPEPNLSFKLKALGGSLTGVQAISDLIEDLVYDTLYDTMVWPKRIVVKLNDGDYSDLELRLTGRLRVDLIRANNLKNTELFGGKSDPFVVLYTRVKFQKKSKVIHDSQNPEWDETFELQCEDIATQKLVLKVMDKGMISGREEKLGVVAVRLNVLERDKPMEVTVDLLSSLQKSTGKKISKGLGTITVQLTWHKYSLEEQAAAMAKELSDVEAKILMERTSGVLGSVGNVVGGAVTDVAELLGDGVGAAAGVLRSLTNFSRVSRKSVRQGSSESFNARD